MTSVSKFETRSRRTGWLAAALTLLLVALVGCGGGNSTVTTITGGGTGAGAPGPDVALSDPPTGSNTTEVVVDSGPASGFSLGVANVPFVTVTVCSPGSSSQCVTIDHVVLDTGSYGLRVLKSAVNALTLPPLLLPADAASSTPAGPAFECYAFVIGALWGPIVTADVRVAGELAGAIPIQLIDDTAAPERAAPKDCVDSASPGGLLNSAAALQANGVLGVGMVGYDCGADCATGNYASLFYAPYYSCPIVGQACVPAAVPIDLQVQNPVVHFKENNNGTIIVMPAVPEYGAKSARGRLVFGIGTQANNQIPLSVTRLAVDANPLNRGGSYLSLSAALNGKTYTDSYIDSGSNAYFFDDASIPNGCTVSSGASGGWFCPPTTRALTATLTGINGAEAQVDFAVANADLLFLAPNFAYGDLAGSIATSSTQGAATSDTLVWGMPFFYGRTVFTAIWGQALAINGPWFAF
jgi:hypothetical protein